MDATDVIEVLGESDLICCITEIGTPTLHNSAISDSRDQINNYASISRCSNSSSWSYIWRTSSIEYIYRYIARNRSAAL